MWYGGWMMVWVVINKGGTRNWWPRMKTSQPSCSWTFWKISAFNTKEELMETTFGWMTLVVPSVTGTIYPTIHELAQAPTKDSDALDIEIIGNLVDSVLWPLDDLIRSGLAILDFGEIEAFETVQLNIWMHCSKITKNLTFSKFTDIDKLWQNSQFCCSSGSFSF